MGHIIHFPSNSALLTLRVNQLLGLPVLLHSHPTLVPTWDISSVQRFAFKSSARYFAVNALFVS